MLGSGQFKPHIGHPSPGVLCWGDGSPWQVGRPPGLTGELWGTWTYSGGAHMHWPAPTGGVEVLWPQFSRDSLGARPSWCRGNEPPFTLGHSVTLDQGGHDQEESSAVGNAGVIWVGQSLGEAAGAIVRAYSTVPQKQPRSLRWPTHHSSCLPTKSFQSCPTLRDPRDWAH